MNTLYYGALDKNHVKDAARKAVVAFGGGDKAYRLLIETCCAETHCCEFPDANPLAGGIGGNQMDLIGFDDVLMHVRKHDVESFRLHYGRDIHSIKHTDLAQDIELSFAFTRLKYKRVPAPIPETLEGRANYWKRHYNTFHPNAKGTIEGYLDKVRMFKP